MTAYKVQEEDDELGVVLVEALYGGSVRIEPAAAPPSPAEEELAAAKAWL